MGWLMALGVVIAGGVAWGGAFTDTLTVPGTQSANGQSFIENHVGMFSGVSARLVFHGPPGVMNRPEVRDALPLAIDLVRRTKDVLDIDDPNEPGRTSSDGSAVIVDVIYAPGPPPGLEAIDRLRTAQGPLERFGVLVDVGGVLPEIANDPSPGPLEYLGIVVAAIVLYFAFGSWRNATLPIITAAAGVGVGMGLVWIIAGTTSVSSFAPQLAGMIGLGVGIDYALLIVTRYTAERRGGRNGFAAIERALSTAGRSCVVAGATVTVSILGLVVVRVPFITNMALATVICVAGVVTASVTLLPAFLAVWDEKILTTSGGRERRSTRFGTRFVTGLMNRIADKPVQFLLGAFVVVAAIGAPAGALRVGFTDASSAAVDTTQRRAYDVVSSAFGPGANASLTLAIDMVEVHAAARQDVVERARSALRSSGVVRFASQVAYGQQGEQALIRFDLLAAPSSDQAQRAVESLRGHTIPAAVSGTGAHTFVAGATATKIDLARRVGESLPVLVATVVAVSILLLMRSLRSVLVPIKAAILNMLSVFAAYGVVVATFQWGWLKGLVGLDSVVAIDAFVPVFMFGILFGLSMDYEVFLISRIRELHDGGVSTRDSVVNGVTDTARVVSSAATIMVAIFSGFIFASDPVTKMFGVGLSVAVLVDATLIRFVLLPSAMALLGELNWWWPGRQARVAKHDLLGP